MPLLSDCHLHSTFSGDAKDSMEKMILKGIDLGLKNMCFTEHMDIDFDYKLNNLEDGMFELNTDSYLYELLGLREKYADKMNILFGVEIGVQPHLRRPLALYAKEYEFDFIIASTHVIDRYDPYRPEYFNRYANDEEAYRRYFKEIYENLKVFGNFDVLGHLDYIVRVGKSKDENYSYEAYKDVIDPILEKLIDMEKGLELNSGSIPHSLRQMHPATDILKKYRSMGGELITFGSDAHKTSDIARGLKQAEEILTECGFKYYATFEKRVPNMHKI